MIGDTILGFKSLTNQDKNVEATYRVNIHEQRLPKNGYRSHEVYGSHEFGRLWISQPFYKLRIWSLMSWLVYSAICRGFSVHIKISPKNEYSTA